MSLSVDVALPSKPLNLIALSDADSGSALSYVKQKLHDTGIDVEFTPEQVSYIQRLGGRANDLEVVSIRDRYSSIEPSDISLAYEQSAQWYEHRASGGRYHLPRS
jgi:hypothetical protein